MKDEICRWREYLKELIRNGEREVSIHTVGLEMRERGRMRRE